MAIPTIISMLLLLTQVPAEWQHRSAVVLLFISADCPISNRYAPTINELVKQYGPGNTGFYAVLSDPDVTQAQPKQYAHDYGFQFPFLLDPDQKLAARYGVMVTPTAVVVSPKGICFTAAASMTARLISVNGGMFRANKTFAMPSSMCLRASRWSVHFPMRSGVFSRQK